MAIKQCRGAGEVNQQVPTPYAKDMHAMQNALKDVHNS